MICGAPGTGKTVTAWEVGQELQRAEIPHALIDEDNLIAVWPPPSTDDLLQLKEGNLRDLWASYSQFGVKRWVLSGVMERLQDSREWIDRAISPARITVVRLVASQATRRSRIATREVGSGFERDALDSDRLAKLIDENQSEHSLRISSDEMTLVELAHTILSKAGWV